MGNFDSLIDALESADSGERVADALAKILADIPSAIALQAWLDSALRNLSSYNLVGTASQQAVMDMLEKSVSGGMTLADVQAQGTTYSLPSLGSQSHASRVVNELAGLGLVGKWRESKGPGRPITHFGLPQRAVLNGLTRIDVMPSEVDDEVMLELSGITGMSLAKVVEVMRSMG